MGRTREEQRDEEDERDRPARKEERWTMERETLRDAGGNSTTHCNV